MDPISKYTSANGIFLMTIDNIIRGANKEQMFKTTEHDIALEHALSLVTLTENNTEATQPFITATACYIIATSIYTKTTHNPTTNLLYRVYRTYASAFYVHTKWHPIAGPIILNHNNFAQEIKSEIRRIINTADLDYMCMRRGDQESQPMIPHVRFCYRFIMRMIFNKHTSQMIDADRLDAILRKLNGHLPTDEYAPAGLALAMILKPLDAAHSQQFLHDMETDHTTFIQSVLHRHAFESILNKE